MLIFNSDAVRKETPLVVQKKESDPEFKIQEFSQPAKPSSLKGKVRLFKEIAPSVMNGVIKTAVTAVVVLGLAIVFIPIFIPIIILGTLACFVATPFIMLDSMAKKENQSLSVK